MQQVAERASSVLLKSLESSFFSSSHADYRVHKACILGCLSAVPVADALSIWIT